MRKTADVLRKGAAWLCMGITCAMLIWIIGYVLIHGMGAWNGAFFKTISPMIITTIYMVLIALVIATPIGAGAAVYLVEYAKPGKVVEVLRFAIESLSGIPSIIYGLFGMIFFVKVCGLGWSILSGALTVSIMILPVVIRSTEESLRAVADTYREASLALGASKLRTIVKVILPAASSGIISAIILSIGRIVGETAAIYLTAGTVERMPSGVLSSGSTLAVYLYMQAKEAISFQNAYGAALVLIVLILIINISANILSDRIQTRNRI